MKSFVLVFLFVSTIFAVNAQTFTEAAKYNDYIVNQQNLIGEKLLAFTGNFNNVNLTIAEVTPDLEDLLAIAQNVVAAVKRITPFEGDTQLKQSAIELFQFYATTIDNDYREMVNLFFRKDVSDSDIARLQEIIQKVTASEASYDENFQTAQQAFASKHGFTLEANQLQEEIDKN